MEDQRKMKVTMRILGTAALVITTITAARVLYAAVLTASEPNRPADDKSIIAALDTEYQAAVKANDANTMDRILTDDFVLVTGRAMSTPRPTCSKKRERKRSSTNARRTPTRRFASGVTRRLSPRSCGQRAPEVERLSSTDYGSATLTFVHQAAGAMSSATPRLRFPQPPIDEREDS